jgi:hypothetical protein
LKLIKKLGTAIRNLISPPTWESLTDEQRQQLLSMSRRKRKQLARAMAEDTVIDSRLLQINGGHASALDTGGAEGADAGGALGNILGDWRREQMREARRQGERNDR